MYHFYNNPYATGAPSSSARPTQRPTQSIAGAFDRYGGNTTGSNPGVIAGAFNWFGGRSSYDLATADGLSVGTPVVGAYSTGASNGGGTINTTQVDGQAGWLNNLSGLGAAVLDNLGAQRDAPAPYVQNAAYRSSATPPWVPLAIVAAIGFGIYQMNT